MKENTMNANVLAVIVSYNPELKILQKQLDALREQPCDVVIVDNASENQKAVAALVDSIGSSTPSVTLLKQTSNQGLGAAHNHGIRLAREHQYSHVLLLDQDSLPKPDMLKNLLAVATAKSDQQVSAVGPKYLNAENNSESFFVNLGVLRFKRRYCTEQDQDADGSIETDFLISSGSLISLTALDGIGLMDESLFIDHVDTEWFLRAKSKGYVAYGACNAVMQHSLGEATRRIELGERTYNVSEHKPFRYYYIFRNSILLYKRLRMCRLWCWKDLQRLIMLALLFGARKQPSSRANAKMMWRGVRDGLRGIDGPLQD